jgi:hypothetical protein
VPEITLNVDFKFVLLSRGTGHAARMLTPGPIMSGFRIPGLAVLGPLEEKEATVGADDSPIIVPLNKIVAVGAELELM